MVEFRRLKTFSEKREDHRSDDLMVFESVESNVSYDRHQTIRSNGRRIHDRFECGTNENEPVIPTQIEAVLVEDNTSGR
jgi:hypothetical protein